MQIPPLTNSQAGAASAPDRLLLIEAGPGSGKTRTVTERFGTLTTAGSRNGVAVLSFTTAATSLLRRRILLRWGRSALAWPNRCRTLDSEFRSILEYLLRSGELTWPGGHKSLVVLDDWGKRDMVRRATGPAWAPALSNRSVIPAKHIAQRGDVVVSARKRLEPQLEEGRCTHDGVRDIVVQAASQADIRSVIVELIRNTTSAVIVDEAFDANETDAELLALFAEAGCEVTLVGDHWQAIYGFRNADPQTIRKKVIGPLGFRTIPLSDSFRFRSDQTKRLAEDLRSGGSCCPLPEASEPNVVLAPEWRMLWDAAEWVLPSAFGPVQSQIGAGLSLALDHFMRGQSIGPARLTGTACALLGIDELHYRESAEDAFGPVLRLLKANGEAGAEEALDLIQDVAKSVLGAPRRPTVKKDQRPRYELALANLARRLAHTGAFTPGLTVHQAKGEEYGTGWQ